MNNEEEVARECAEKVIRQIQASSLPLSEQSSDIASIIASALHVQRQAVWQPIETAPKDKTYVIVGLADKKNIWRVSEAAFNGLGWYDKGGKSCHWANIWMPLPALSTSQEQHVKSDIDYLLAEIDNRIERHRQTCRDKTILIEECEKLDSEIDRLNGKIAAQTQARQSDQADFERIATALGTSYCCGAETMKLVEVAERVGKQLKGEDVTAALEELREMLPNHQASITHRASDVIHGIRGCGQTRQIENQWEVKLWPYQVFTGTKIAEVMQRVREWKAQNLLT